MGFFANRNHVLSLAVASAMLSLGFGVLLPVASAQAPAPPKAAPAGAVTATAAAAIVDAQAKVKAEQFAAAVAALTAAQTPARTPADDRALDFARADAEQAWGWDLVDIHESDAGRTHLQAALALDQRYPQRKAQQGTDLRRIGISYMYQSQNETALNYYAQALPIHQQVKDRDGEASALMDMGNVYDALSQYEKAIGYYQQALLIYQQVKDRKGEAKALNNLGSAYDDPSQYEKAITYYQQALLIYQQVKDRKGEAEVLNNLGIAYDGLGQHEKAIGYNAQALTIFQQVKDLDGEASALNNLGNVYRNQSQYEKAIGYYQQALPIFQQVKDRVGEANALNNLGAAYNDLSQHEKAIGYYQQALPIFQQVKDRDGEAYALNGLGNAYRDQSQYETAIGYFERALTIFQQVKDRDEEARVLNNLNWTQHALSGNELYILAVGPTKAGMGDIIARLKKDATGVFGYVDSRLIPTDGTGAQSLPPAKLKAAVDAEIDRIAASSQSRDTFVFLLSGAAKTVVPTTAEGAKSELALLPFRADSAAPSAGADDAAGIRARQLRAWLDRVPAQRQMVIVDADCPDRPFRAFTEALTDDNGIGADATGRQTLVLGAVGQRPAMRGDDTHSPLTRAVLNALSEGASTAVKTDASGHALVTAASLEAFLREKLLQVSSGQQRLSSDFIGDDFPITSPVAPSSSNVQYAEAAQSRGAQLASEQKSGFQRQGRDYALLIGTDDYDPANGLHHLNNPVHDAEKLQACLQEGYGFDTTSLNAPLLSPSKKDVTDCLRRLADKPATDWQPDDQLLIFIAGHGEYSDELEQGLALFKDGKALDQDPDLDTGLRFTDLTRMINRIGCPHILLVLDACESGTIFRGDLPPAKPKTERASANELLFKNSTRKTRLCLTSGGKEYVADGDPNHPDDSPFLYRLWARLSQEAGSTGSVLTPADLWAAVKGISTTPEFAPLGGDNAPGADFLFIARGSDPSLSR